jgi:hypothetical protein
VFSVIRIFTNKVLYYCTVPNDDAQLLTFCEPKTRRRPPFKRVGDRRYEPLKRMPSSGAREAETNPSPIKHTQGTTKLSIAKHIMKWKAAINKITSLWCGKHKRRSQKEDFGPTLPHGITDNLMAETPSPASSGKGERQAIRQQIIDLLQEVAPEEVGNVDTMMREPWEGRERLLLETLQGIFSEVLHNKNVWNMQTTCINPDDQGVG